MCRCTVARLTPRSIAVCDTHQRFRYSASISSSLGDWYVVDWPVKTLCACADGANPAGLLLMGVLDNCGVLRRSSGKSSIVARPSPQLKTMYCRTLYSCLTFPGHEHAFNVAHTGSERLTSLSGSKRLSRHSTIYAKSCRCLRGGSVSFAPQTR